MMFCGRVSTVPGLLTGPWTHSHVANETLVLVQVVCIKIIDNAWMHDLATSYVAKCLEGSVHTKF